MVRLLAPNLLTGPAFPANVHHPHAHTWLADFYQSIAHLFPSDSPHGEVLETVPVR